MREAVVIACFLLVACGDAGGPEQGKSKADEAKALALAPGQWETVTEVSQLTRMDEGAPKIDTPQGTRIEASHCVADGEGKQPPAVLLAGSDAYECKYGNHYMSAGTLNTQLECRREGLNGQVMMSLDGSYTADTIEANHSLSTSLSGTGDVKILSKLTGRRVGDCQPDAATKTG